MLEAGLLLQQHNYMPSYLMLCGSINMLGVGSHEENRRMEAVVGQSGQCGRALTCLYMKL